MRLIVTGSIAYDFAHHEVRFKDIRSGLRLTEAIVWVDPKYFKEVVDYKFRRPPNLVVNGVFHFHGKNDHMKGNEHAVEAQKHSKVASAASDEAHAKSSSKK